MKKGSFILICLVIVFLTGHVTTAGAASLSLAPSKTEVTKGGSLSLDIRVDEAGGVAGGTFTLVYPQNVLNPADIPVTTGFFKLFYDQQQNADPAQIYPWDKNTETTGEIRLSGAYINTDTSTGGGGNYSGSQTLFTVSFNVKSDAATGSYNFELKQTRLCNGPLGWGTDVNNNGQCDEADGDVKAGVPILLKSYPKGSSQFSTMDVSDDFETLIASFGTNPQASFTVAEKTSAETFTLTLQSSWNLVAIPAVPSDASVNAVFAGIKDNIASSWKWKNNKWAVYLPSLAQEDASAYISSKGFTAITTITAGEGIWINSNSSQNLAVQGTQPQDSSSSLDSGWNLIGLKANQTKSITALISGNEMNISSIWKWTNNKWGVYLPSGGTDTYATSKGFSVIANIEPNEGFWVNAQKALTLN